MRISDADAANRLQRWRDAKTPVNILFASHKEGQRLGRVRDVYSGSFTFEWVDGHVEEWSYAGTIADISPDGSKLSLQSMNEMIVIFEG